MRTDPLASDRFALASERRDGTDPLASERVRACARKREGTDPLATHKRSSCLCTPREPPTDAT